MSIRNLIYLVRKSVDHALKEYIFYFKIIEFSLFSVLLYIHIVYLILSIYDIFSASLLMDIVILVIYLQV